MLSKDGSSSSSSSIFQLFFSRKRKVKKWKTEGKIEDEKGERDKKKLIHGTS